MASNTAGDVSITIDEGSEGIPERIVPHRIHFETDNPDTQYTEYSIPSPVTIHLTSSPNERISISTDVSIINKRNFATESRHSAPSSHGEQRTHTSKGNQSNVTPPHCYIDADGRLQVRRTRYWYQRVRRCFGMILPWLSDSNSFVCGQMISNTVLVAMVFLFRFIVVSIVLAILLNREVTQECEDATGTIHKVLATTVIANIFLGVPALNIKSMKLYERDSEVPDTPRGEERSDFGEDRSSLSGSSSSHESSVRHEERRTAHELLARKKFKKTYLFSLCEIIVVCEIFYLTYAVVTLVWPGSSHDIFAVIRTCHNDLGDSDLAFWLVMLTVCLMYVSIYLRYRQIILFHRLHQHFLFQQGCLPGRTLFEYAENNFYAPWFGCVQRKTREIHQIKLELYKAAKRGNLEQLREQLHLAIQCDGPDFAKRWYKMSNVSKEDMDINHGKGNHGLSTICTRWRKILYRKKLLFETCKRNPLHVAVVFDHECIVKELLKHNFDINDMEKIEILKFNVARLYRFLFERLWFLRKANYRSVNSRAIFGAAGFFQTTLLSPLHAAVTMGHINLTHLLLKSGANPNKLALSNNRKFATPPLFWAINRECARLLLNANANPLYMVGHGYFVTAYEAARVEGNHTVAKEMEFYGGDVALTPLHDACSKGRHQEVQFFLKHGANVDCIGESVLGYWKRTPMHWAAIRGKTEVINTLIQYGAQIDAKDLHGRTPLVWACLLGRTECVETLLQNGADPNVVDVYGDNILCICAENLFGSLTLSIKTNKRSGSTLSDASVFGDEIDGQSLNHRSKAREEKMVGINSRILQLLIAHGIHLDAARKSNGDSALHVALRNNNERAAILYVRGGISVTATNIYGERPVDVTNSSHLRYAVKKEAGHRDVMISYTHSRSALARKVRDALEAAHITTWIDSMDPSGITGGSIWRKEIANGIQSSALVLALLTDDYPQSQWCMKELAFAKMHNVPVVAIQCEDMVIDEELQVYLWTRQIVDFRPAILSLPSGVASIDNIGDNLNYNSLKCDEISFKECMQLLLDGIQDQVEEHRMRLALEDDAQKLLISTKDLTMHLPPTESDFSGDGDSLDKNQTRPLLNAIRRSHSATLSPSAYPLSSPVMFSRHDIDGTVKTIVSTSHTAVPPFYPVSSIFICHGDFHVSFCKKLKRHVESHGWNCTVDYDLGRKFKKSSNENSPKLPRQLAAKDAILESDIIFVVLSSLSSRSDVVADQLAFAEDRGKLVIPIMLSLHVVDQAKRYTFSRSTIHHFNMSLGIEQSMKSLTDYLYAYEQKKAMEPKKPKSQVREYNNKGDLLQLPQMDRSTSEPTSGRRHGWSLSPSKSVGRSKSPT